MNADKIASLASLVIETLGEVTSHGQAVPKSQIYLAFGMDMEVPRIVTDVLVHNGWIKATSDTICLTDSGRELFASAVAEVANQVAELKELQAVTESWN